MKAPLPGLAPPTGITPASHSLGTVVSGQVEGMHSRADWLIRLAECADRVGDTMHAQRAKTETVWPGDAGDGYREKLRGHGDQAEHLYTAASTIGAALRVLAREIAAVRATIDQARQDARAAGYVTTSNTIEFPMPLVNPAASGPSAGIVTAVTTARQRERHAHAEFARVAHPHLTFLDFFFKTMPNRIVGLLRGTFTTATREHAANATKLRNTVASAAAMVTSADGVAQQALTDTIRKGLPGVVIDHYIQQLRRPLAYDLSDALKLGTTTAKGRFATGFSASGGALSIAGTTIAIAQGAEPDRAIATGTASWAAGAITHGAIVAALGVSGPPGWIALGAGLVVSAGVGWIVDHHWDSIEDWGSDRINDIKNLF
ncbi:hypothetical protein [Actinokineospora sp. UTMC 2448]|uniref:hypothetical protein n=1 Tax=Actinokineospora sp. UTMC 2448 TaxID=2268449 RepID=UPI002164B634|nr:hypothetical protein [Actinokineospora sp. UTMC 2448]UVS78407.1 hypothetical protein Actkin_02140 [Actinokineospora sp. UTMC 2448]